MTVRIAKPSVNIREKLAELERPIGLNGQALLATETPQQAFDLLGAGRRNLVINGSMNIWQRGTSFLNLAAQGATNYTADRWNATRYSSGDHDVTRQEVNHLGFIYALRSERSVGDTGSTSRYINQPIESSISRTLAGKYVTLSFYARRGSGMPTISGVNLSAYIAYHVEDNYLDNGIFYIGFKNANTFITSSKDLLLSTDFQKFELTGFIPSNVRQIGISVGTPEGLPTAIANDYFDITGVQLEAGKVATPFEYRSYGQELALCQRYYFVYDSGRFITTSNSTSIIVGSISYPEYLRVNPTITYYGGNSTTGNVRFFSAGSGVQSNYDQTANNLYTAFTSTHILAFNSSNISIPNGYSAWVDLGLDTNSLKITGNAEL